jgi:hypothetical protein
MRNLAERGTSGWLRGRGETRLSALQVTYTEGLRSELKMTRGHYWALYGHEHFMF